MINWFTLKRVSTDVIRSNCKLSKGLEIPWARPQTFRPRMVNPVFRAQNNSPWCALMTGNPRKVWFGTVYLSSQNALRRRCGIRAN